LVSDEQDIGGGIVQAGLKMIDDSSAGAHAAVGADDGGAVEIRYFLFVMY
jgi:hypothetical protein